MMDEKLNRGLMYLYLFVAICLNTIILDAVLHQVLEFLNQAHAGLLLSAMLVCVCLCLPPRLLINIHVK